MCISVGTPYNLRMPWFYMHTPTKMLNAAEPKLLYDENGCIQMRNVCFVAVFICKNTSQHIY